jgi:hypothetical protein
MLHIIHFHSRAALQAGQQREGLGPYEKKNCFFRNPGMLERKEVFFIFSKG